MSMRFAHAADGGRTIQRKPMWHAGIDRLRSAVGRSIRPAVAVSAQELAALDHLAPVVSQTMPRPLGFVAPAVRRVFQATAGPECWAR